MSNKFEQTTPQVNLPSTTSYAEKSFLHTTGAAVVVPFWQSLIIASAVGLASFVVFVRFGSMIIDAFWNALTVTVIVFLLTFVFLLRHWFALTIERTFNIDIPGMGEEKPKEPKVTRIQIDELTRQGHIRQVSFIDLPISESKLKTLAAGLMAGRPFSEREWAGSGKLMSSSEFRELRQELIRRELLEQANSKDPRQGYRLNVRGEAVMKTYADLLFSPTGDGDGEE